MKASERKAQVVEEATRLFSQHGYDKVTVKQLAGACGISEPAVYRHFESKSAIYEAVLDSLQHRLNSEQLFERLESGRDLTTLFRGLAEHVLAVFQQNEDLCRLLLFCTLTGHTEARKVFKVIRGPYVQFLKKQLDFLYEEGLIVDKDNELTARCFVGMVFDCALGCTVWKGFQGRHIKPADAVANNVPIYVRGLTVDKE